jgi:hypothetical protein
MNIGDTVTYDDRPLVVRGIDPEGVEPRYIYLEDERTGRTFSARYEEPSRAQRTDSFLHLVDGDEAA